LPGPDQLHAPGFHEVNPGDRFLANWHVDCLCWHLEKCYRREIKRLIITLPPCYLKSICASVAFPAWVLGQDPTRRLICVSYSQDLARKHALDTPHGDGQRLVQEHLPGARVSSAQVHRDRADDQPHGSALRHLGGRAADRLGGNVVIIDDPIKADGAASEAERQRVKPIL
jgi:hypothetical protein